MRGQQIMAKVGMSARELACLPRVTTGWLQRADCEINPTLPVILGPRPPMLYRASQKGAYVFKFGGIMQPVERAALKTASRSANHGGFRLLNSRNPGHAS